MNLERIKTYIGLAMRAGKCSCGESACRAAILKGEARILLISESMSQGTRNKLVSICRDLDIPVQYISSEAEIGEWAGRPGRLCMTINNEGLAGEIMKICKLMDDINRGVN